MSLQIINNNVFVRIYINLKRQNIDELKVISNNINKQKNKPTHDENYITHSNNYQE